MNEKELKMQHSKELNHQPKVNERCWARLSSALHPRWMPCKVLAISENGMAVRLYMKFDGEEEVVDCWLGKVTDVVNRQLDKWEFLPAWEDPKPQIGIEVKGLCANSIS